VSQCFHWVTPVECTPGVTGGWHDVDLDSYVVGLGADTTGAMLHVINTSTTTDYNFGYRKNGSTWDMKEDMLARSHFWVMVGVDASRIFELYIENKTYQRIYLVGYTTTGVEFFTNGYDKSLFAAGMWLDIDCSGQCPSGAYGLIFHHVGTILCEYPYDMALRCDGSTDDRKSYNSALHNPACLLTKCMPGRVCEGYIEHTDVDFYLAGYVTDGAILHTNRPFRTPGGTGSWTDLTAFPSRSAGGFYEAHGSGGRNSDYGLRKNGSSENWQIPMKTSADGYVECDSSDIVEGLIDSILQDIYEIGYAEKDVASGAGGSGAGGVTGGAARLLVG